MLNPYPKTDAVAIIYSHFIIFIQCTRCHVLWRMWVAPGGFPCDEASMLITLNSNIFCHWTVEEGQRDTKILLFSSYIGESMAKTAVDQK